MKVYRKDGKFIYAECSMTAPVLMGKGKIISVKHFTTEDRLCNGDFPNLLTLIILF